MYFLKSHPNIISKTKNSHWVLQQYQSELRQDGDPFCIIDAATKNDILFELLVPINFTNEWANLHGFIVNKTKNEYIEWINVHTDDCFQRFVDHSSKTIHCSGRMVIELRERMFQDNARFFKDKIIKKKESVLPW